MAVFEYKGINAQGKAVAGLIDSDSVPNAKGKLRKEGIFPTFVKEAQGDGSSAAGSSSAPLSFFNRVSVQELAEMTRQLSTLVAAHIPLVEALAALVEQTENPQLKGILATVKDSVNEGSSLGNALEVHPKAFTALYINMVKAGEASGALDRVLLKLADFLEAQVRLKNKIVSTMAYPAIMAVIAMLMIVGLFTFIIPKITSLFDELNATLPLPTRFLIAVSEIASNYWYVVIAFMALAYWAFQKYTRSKSGKYRYHAFLLKIPIFGNLIRLVAISRFAGTLSTLLAAGVPLLNALHIVKNIVTNVILQDAIKEAASEIKEGSSLAAPLKRHGEFPPMLVHMIAVGERVGNLEEMLSRASASYDNQVDAKITTLTSLLEPMMIVGMGGTVGFIVMAILMPILNMQQLIK